MTEAEIDEALAHMELLTHDATGWSTLYRDPATGALWELTYPHSGMHGGGPRHLAPIAMEEAATKYDSEKISN